MPLDVIRKELSIGLIKWYDFKENAKVLYIAGENDSLRSVFEEKNMEMVCVSLLELSYDFADNNKMSFDYIVAINVLEQSKALQRDLAVLRQLLKSDGVLLLGMDNRLGLRYFCGDKDKYTGKLFDSIENYKRMLPGERAKLDGRMYSKAEIEESLRSCGINIFKFYSVLPDLETPQLLYAHDYDPVEQLSTRYIPAYKSPDTVFLDESLLYCDLVENGLFHAMANAYLVECPMNGVCAPVRHVTVSMDRGRENAMFTIIYENGKVEKRAAYFEGKTRLQQMADYCVDLKNHGIKVVNAAVENGAFVMPYVDAEIATSYLARLARTDSDCLIKEMDRFKDTILQSSEHIREDCNDGMGVTLKRGYVDLVPLNCFVIDGEYVFYDQEFCEENCLANMILYRMLVIAYSADIDMNKILPMDFFLKRYGLDRELALWSRKAYGFISDLRQLKELAPFYKRHRTSAEMINSNRQRMNYSREEYQRLFVDIFSVIGNKKLIVFGSGAFAKKFVEIYRRDYPILAIVDNNPDKWGETLNEIPIISPNEMAELERNNYKVIICIKNYSDVMKQLKTMGIKDIGVYDPTISYKQPPAISRENKNSDGHRKYHVGYIAGVFDLFHIGHLNLLKRAKEQCDYLIAGVVTDEAVRRDKKTEPFIPFEERIEIVRSCRYVDEAVEIPPNYVSTGEAYKLYHFDCQFSGSDYADNPEWDTVRKFLESQGAEMVFFPYTESTSSTKIKEMINKRLM